MTSFANRERMRDAATHIQVSDTFSTKPSNVRISFAACAHGPCDQGRKLCPSPDACRLPESRFDREGAGLFKWGAIALALVVAAVGFGIWTSPHWGGL